MEGGTLATERYDIRGHERQTPLFFLSSAGRLQSAARRSRGFSVVCSLKDPIPRSYAQIHAGTESSVKAAIKEGLKMLEVQFPPLAGSAKAGALSETMDANRSHAREILRGFTGPYSGSLIVAFPDGGEAKLAQKAWETEEIRQSFDIATIASAAGLKEKSLVFAINPGFNVDEYIDLEKYDDDRRVIVVFNGDLDKIRGGYYPRLFYPKLHKVAEKSLRKFEPVYYLKQLANRGTLIRAYPEPWRLYFTNANGESELLTESNERPAYPDLEKSLRQAADGERLRG